MKLELFDRLWFPVDVSSAEEASQLYGPLAELVPNVKVGLKLMYAIGAPAAVALMRELGAKKVWMDGKFYDISATVGGASASTHAYYPDIFNVAIGSGPPSVKEAVANKGSALVLGVTILTNLDAADLSVIGFGDDPAAISIPDIVARRIRTGFDFGLDGIICSPQELSLFREHRLLQVPGIERLLKFTPGVRPEWAAGNDQKRTGTPTQAFNDGATAIVCGRPISDPPAGMTPADAVKRIFDEIANALA